MTTEINPTAPDASPTAVGGIVPPAIDPNTIEKVPFRGALRRLTISNFFANIGIFMLWGAIPSVLLQTQVQNIAPNNRSAVASITVILTIGAFAAMIAQPIAGLVSDRTRGRFGRRAPWMLAGTIVGGLALIGLGSSNSIVQVTVVWAIVQVAYNFAQGPLSAILPDRVPQSARGLFSSVTGLGTMLGAIGGGIVASKFVHHIPAGYLTLAGIALVVTVIFVVLNPDKSNKGEPRSPFSFVVFLKTFWVNPVKYPDFFWGFTGRLLLFVGYYLVSGFQLLVLEHYIGLSRDNAAVIFGTLGAVSLLPILISIVLAGPISDRIGRRKPVAVFAGIVMAVALLIPLLMPSVTGMFIYVVVNGLGFGAYMAVDGALMSQVLPSKEEFGKDLGVLNIAATLPQTLGPALAGLIVLVVGYQGLFPIGAVIALAGALAVLPIKSVR
jgi:MFS family permease